MSHDLLSAGFARPSEGAFRCARRFLWKSESRTESAPTVLGSSAFRRMVLSEAIPITTAAWVSQAQPILRFREARA
ncbi:hypothetical protein PCLA_05f0544 [Pseudomonas citronellolis]|nr:hypothetical protein PCLA_05f0544 [Pseudomonas citronellolis]